MWSEALEQSKLRLPLPRESEVVLTPSVLILPATIGHCMPLGLTLCPPMRAKCKGKCIPRLHQPHASTQAQAKRQASALWLCSRHSGTAPQSPGFAGLGAHLNPYRFACNGVALK